MKRSRKKSLEFEINLIPCMNLLAVCICFLLISAVWVQIGSIGVRQSAGEGGVDADEHPSLWVNVLKEGDLEIEVKNANIPGTLQKIQINGVEGRLDLGGLERYITEVKASAPELNMALIQPQSVTALEDIVRLLDQFKRSGILDLGITPL